MSENNAIRKDKDIKKILDSFILLFPLDYISKPLVGEGQRTIFAKNKSRTLILTVKSFIIKTIKINDKKFWRRYEGLFRQT